MIRIPELFADGVAEQQIYYFATAEVENPHFYICIKRTDGNILYMSICTSQFETIRKFVETRHLPFETLVFIKPNTADENNPFSKETFVNCNNVFTFTIDELTEKYINGEISYKGQLEDIYYEQLLLGIHASPLVDEEVKEFIPNTLPNSDSGED
jgi:hypothetical protein